MRKIFVVLMALVVLLSISLSVEAKKPRKLPLGTYVSSAKINIMSGDLERYPDAIALLDSLFMYYGPQAEALYWMAQMQVDYIDNASNPTDKVPYVDAMVAYADSLHMCCQNPDIKKKNKKDCDHYIELVDSIKVQYWTEFYNSGIEQLNNMTDLNGELGQTSDSGMTDFYTTSIAANFDSCKLNFEMAIKINSSGYKSYVALGSANEIIGKYDEAVMWKEKGLEYIEDKSSLQMSMGYDFVDQGNYCKAIPYLRAYIDDNIAKHMADTSLPVDTITLYNLSICYKHSDCQQFDSAAAVYRRLLEFCPNHVDALRDLGLYYNQMSIYATNSIKDAGDNADSIAILEGVRDLNFDSALVYFSKAFASNPNDVRATSSYAVLAAIKQQYEEAAVAFLKLTELEPTVADNFISLGDCYLNLEQYENSVKAYEGAVALEPDNRDLWEILVGMYKQVKDSDGEARAKAKLKSLK